MICAMARCCRHTDPLADHWSPSSPPCALAGSKECSFLVTTDLHPLHSTSSWSQVISTFCGQVLQRYRSSSFTCSSRLIQKRFIHKGFKKNHKKINVVIVRQKRGKLSSFVCQFLRYTNCLHENKKVTLRRS